MLSQTRLPNFRVGRGELERRRRLDRVHAVIDFDMFYAAVELRDRPALRAKPVAVGRLPTTASLEGMVVSGDGTVHSWSSQPRYWSYTAGAIESGEEQGSAGRDSDEMS